MRIKRWLYCTVVLLASPLLLQAQDPPCGRDSQPPYEDSEDSLKRLITDIRAAIRNQDQKQVQMLGESLIIKEPDRCFESIFGKEEGNLVAEVYRKLQRPTGDPIPGELKGAAADESPEITVERITSTAETKVSGLDSAILNAMLAPVSLYRATYKRRYVHGSRQLGHYIYAGGGFRRVETDAFLALSTAPARRLRVGGNVMAGRLIHKAAPRYPEAAKTGLIQGTVRLRAVIARDGTIRELEVLSGPSELVEATLDAVRQWRYEQTFLNGVSIEVETTIDVVYTLSR